MAKILTSDQAFSLTREHSHETLWGFLLLKMRDNSQTLKHHYYLAIMTQIMQTVVHLVHYNCKTFSLSPQKVPSNLLYIVLPISFVNSMFHYSRFKFRFKESKSKRNFRRERILYLHLHLQQQTEHTPPKTDILPPVQ